MNSTHLFASPTREPYAILMIVNNESFVWSKGVFAIDKSFSANCLLYGITPLFVRVKFDVSMCFLSIYICFLAGSISLLSSLDNFHETL